MGEGLRRRTDVSRTESCLSRVWSRGGRWAGFLEGSRAEWFGVTGQGFLSSRTPSALLTMAPGCPRFPWSGALPTPSAASVSLLPLHNPAPSSVSSGRRCRMTDGQWLPLGDTCHCQWSQALGTRRRPLPQPRCAAGWLSKRKWLPRAPHTTSPGFPAHRPEEKSKTRQAQAGLCVGVTRAPNWLCQQRAPVFVPTRLSVRKRMESDIPANIASRSPALVAKRPCYPSSEWLRALPPRAAGSRGGGGQCCEEQRRVLLGLT